MLRSRLLSRPRDFTASELATLLAFWGYREELDEHTPRTQIVFYHPESRHVVRLSRPRPGDTLKRYQLDQVIDELTERGLLL